MILQLMLKCWKELLIILLLIIMTIFWQINQSTKKELEKIKLEQTSIEQLNNINSKLNEIQDRQKNLYPQIDANISSINKNIKDSKDKLANIEKNFPKKEIIYENFKTKNINEISIYFSNNGYPNIILNR
jgi:predicted PurR-regulated permease PerM